MSFCPTSNLFLGSGLFDLQRARELGVRVGWASGTDVGAGTSFSMLQTMNEAYKVLQLQGQQLSAESAFHLATLGGAHSLYLDDRIGNFAPRQGSRLRRPRPAGHAAARPPHGATARRWPSASSC